MSSSIISQVIEQLAALPDDLQRQVLEYVQALNVSERTPGGSAQLLRFPGTISPQDLAAMQAAIEAGTEQVDLNEW